MSISFDRLRGLKARGVKGVGVFSMLVGVAGVMLGFCLVSSIIVAMAVVSRALWVTNRIGQYSAAEPVKSNSNVCWSAAVICNGSVTLLSCLPVRLFGTSVPAGIPSRLSWLAGWCELFFRRVSRGFLFGKVCVAPCSSFVLFACVVDRFLRWYAMLGSCCRCGFTFPFFPRPKARSVAAAMLGGRMCLNYCGCSD